MNTTNAAALSVDYEEYDEEECYAFDEDYDVACLATAIVEDDYSTAMELIGKLNEYGREHIGTYEINEDGTTFLMVAAQYGMFDVVSRLLGDEADPMIVDQKGNTAAHIAAECGHARVLKLILNYTKNRGPWCPYGENDAGKKPCDLALQSDHADCFNLLYERWGSSEGADLYRDRDDEGATALMRAVREDYLACAELLVPRSNLDAMDDCGLTVLDLAADYYQDQVESMIGAERARREKAELIEALERNLAPIETPQARRACRL